uniref:Uncharacterized protein n=1 Tax=Plectus sambesii TaxID=2011161 RepID=A0A914WGT9_9BILA
MFVSGPGVISSFSVIPQLSMKYALAVLPALLLAVVVLAEEEGKRAALPAMSNRVIAQFLERLPAYKSQQQRRFDLSFEEPSAGGRGFDFELRKRNNAEVVNHILKNFGQLDRLGDVGK